MTSVVCSEGAGVRAAGAALSAGRSRFLHEALDEASGAMSDDDQIVLIWSARGAAPDVGRGFETMRSGPMSSNMVGGTRRPWEGLAPHFSTDTNDHDADESQPVCPALRLQLANSVLADKLA